LCAGACADVPGSDALACTHGYRACQSLTVCAPNLDFRQRNCNAGVAIADACFTCGNGYLKAYVDTCAHADGYAKTFTHARAPTDTYGNV
jgi:hypothetical protein